MEISEIFINNLSVKEEDIVNKISTDLALPVFKVAATVKLLKEDNSVPFISRYRKEATGTLDEVQVRDISHKLVSYENLEERRFDIIKIIFEQGKLTEDLLENLMKASTLAELEDLYAPFKKKKKTRGMIAIEKGLTELADIMEKEKNEVVEKEAERFVSEEKGVANIEEAIQGAKDIIAERVAHSIDNRKIIKDFVLNRGYIVINGLKDKDSSVYKMYYDFKEPLREVKAHRVLAINRGEKEEELEVKIDYEEETCANDFLNNFDINNNYYKEAILDGLKRLLSPAVVREIRSDNSENADSHGITVFSENLTNLLMQPPIKKTRILGIDPGIRTGTKAACLDENGKFLSYFTFFQNNTESAKNILIENIKKYNIELVAVGNGTGSHEVQTVVAEAIKETGMSLKYTVVAEDGASVYSASDIAREEFPELDLTIRGAISIARRLQDPLAELVKIDPKSIGVGLYQHDVNQIKLSEMLDETVESVVNNVGVNINTASFSLLKYVSGITTGLAKQIVRFRDEKGMIRSRLNLKEIPGMGEKTFEQSAGFLKIPESSDPLDNTWVHPENYDVAREIYELTKNNQKITSDKMKELIEKHGIGEATLKDIIEELKKPNRDPRADFPEPIMQEGVVTFDDLKVGMKVTGKVKNVVDFGAFVDLGIKETALIHVSELSDSFVKSPRDFIKVGDVKEFTIIEMDVIRKRISLSLKSGTGGTRTPKQQNEPKKKAFDYSQYMVKD